MKHKLKLLLTLIISLFLVMSCTQKAAPNNPNEPDPNDTTAPAVPSGLLVLGGDQKLEVFWEANEETDLASYILSWTEVDTSSGKSITVDKTENSTEITNLENDKTYSVVISAKDAAGNESEKSEAQLATTFTPDTTAPTILSFSPTGTKVDRNADIVITFSEPIDIGSLVLSISPDRNLDLQNWSADKTILILDPGFARSTLYTLSIEASDPTGNPLAGSKQFSFTTEAPPELPRIIATSPENGTKEIDVRSNISVTFSKPMNRESVEESIIFEPLFKCTFSWSSGDQLLTCDPNDDLLGQTEYTIIIPETAEDQEGNALTETEPISFQTGLSPDTTAPRIVSISPEDGAIGIRRYLEGGNQITPITISFSEAMNKADTQAAFDIHDTSIPLGQFSWNAAGTQMTFTPSSPFAHGRIVLWAISNVAKDLAGNNLISQSSLPTNPYNFRISRQKTVQLPVIAAEDGYVAQDSSLSRFSPVIKVGWNQDEALTYRGFLSFDLSDLPTDILKIQSATLYLRQKDVAYGYAYGSLYSDAIQGIYFQHIDFGTSLSAGAFYEDPINLDCDAITDNFLDKFFCESGSDATHVISSDDEAEWKSSSVLYQLRDDYLNRTERNNRSQYKLRFLKDTGSDVNAQFVYYTEFISGNGTVLNSPYKPYIDVTYEYP